MNLIRNEAVQVMYRIIKFRRGIEICLFEAIWMRYNLIISKEDILGNKLVLWFLDFVSLELTHMTALVQRLNMSTMTYNPPEEAHVRSIFTNV